MRPPLAFFILLGLGGCGDSPLLNHSELTDRPARALGAASGLRFEKLALPFTLTWSAGCPNLTDACHFDFTVSATAPSDSQLSAELWMPGMGHGSSPVLIKRLGPLQWNVTDAYFIMPGHWQVKLKLQLPDGQVDEAILDYRL